MPTPKTKQPQAPTPTLARKRAPVVRIPLQLDVITTDDWTHFVRMVRNVEEATEIVLRLEEELNQKQREIFSRLAAGAQIENNGQIDPSTI